MATRRDALKFITATAAGCIIPWRSEASKVFSMTNLIEKNIPGTSEKLPAIGMGTWQTFDVAETADARKEVKAVLKEFVDMKGKLVDSSPMYGNSESVVGDLSSELGVQSSLFLATKVWTQGMEAGLRQMKNSMDELKTSRIDLMQVHNLVDYNTHLRTLQRWKSEGKIRYIGITHYTVGHHDELAKIIKRDQIDFVQFNFSIATRDAEKTLLPLAADRNVGVIINKPFESGELFSRTKGKQVPSWASEFDCTSWGQFFLKYIIAHPGVTCAIPATAKVHHLKDNMLACYGRLPDEQTRSKMVAHFQSL